MCRVTVSIAQYIHNRGGRYLKSMQGVCFLRTADHHFKVVHAPRTEYYGA